MPRPRRGQLRVADPPFRGLGRKCVVATTWETLGADMRKASRRAYVEIYDGETWLPIRDYPGLARVLVEGS